MALLRQKHLPLASKYAECEKSKVNTRLLLLLLFDLLLCYKTICPFLTNTVAYSALLHYL